jgi:hypothetical protein
MMQHSAPLIAESFTYIFNLTVVPTILKAEHVLSLHEGDDPSDLDKLNHIYLGFPKF